MHLDRGGSIREFLSLAHLLISSVLAGLSQVTHHDPSAPHIEVWLAFVPLCVAASSVVVFAACYLMTRSSLASFGGAMLFTFSGSTCYLLRVLEDNLLVTLWLSLLLLTLIAAARYRRCYGLFITAGVFWALAMLCGLASAPWGLLILLVAWTRPGPWRHRAGHAAVGVSTGIGLLLLLFAFLTSPDRSPPVNPFPRLAEACPSSDVLSAGSSRIKMAYLLLGSYYSLIPLPAAIGEEWGHAYSVIAAGRWPGIGRHIICVDIVLLLIGLASWTNWSDPPRRSTVVSCGACLICLTLLNFTTIDGSFPERFDHIPLLLPPLVATLLARRSQGWNFPRALALVCVLTVAGFGGIYAVVSAGTGAWQYADMKQLSEIRKSREPVILCGPIGADYDMDRLDQNITLWLGAKETFLIPNTDMPRVGYYALRPRVELLNAEVRRTWFHQLSESSPTLLLNVEAMRLLDPLVAENGWVAERVYEGHDIYLRARR